VLTCDRPGILPTHRCNGKPAFLGRWRKSVGSGRLALDKQTVNRKRFSRNYAKFRRLAKLALTRPADFLWFLRSLRHWEKTAPPDWRASWVELFPITWERFETSGHARGHYFLQDLWAARHVCRHSAARHIDVGSSVGGFVAHVASFRPVVYVDIRPLECLVPGIEWQAGSILQLPFEDNSVSSLSCLHVIEHVGLGRYGDPVEPGAWLKGLAELSRVLSPSGQLLLGTPCGRRRLQFNAHRVFDPGDIIQALPSLCLEEFSLIPDEGSTSWVENADPRAVSHLEYACGLFRFTKKAGAMA